MYAITTRDNYGEAINEGHSAEKNSALRGATRLRRTYQ